MASWFKKNVFNIIWSLIFIILLAGAYYAYSNGLFPSQTQFVTTEETNVLDNQNTNIVECTLTITPSVITEGGDVTGIIWTLNPLTFCEIFGKMDGTDDWLKVGEGTTDIDGNYVNTESFSVVGDFTFAAICGDCRTNNDQLTVNPLDVTTCTDSDGINKLLPGHVNIDDVTVAYDECLDDSTVKEYKCVGSSLGFETLACDDGYECVTTRSGGYCEAVEPETFECTDTDGGLDYMTRGVCESSFDMTGNIDTCSSQAIINERFCSAIGTCITASVPCPPPFICIEGACVPV